MGFKLLPVVALVISACGAASSPGAGSAPAAQPAATAAPQATSAPAATAAGTGPAAFLDVAGRAKGASYKITYRMTTGAAGSSAGGEQTWYVKPPKMRYDFAAGAGVASVFVLENGTYFCTSAGGTPMCIGQAQGQAMRLNQLSLGAQIETQLLERPEQFDSTYEGTRTIAGQTAQCYAVKGAAASMAGGELRLCYTGQGTLLLMQSSAGGFAFTMEATSVGNVSDADFQLPATPLTY